jgi:hypothetical protein
MNNAMAGTTRPMPSVSITMPMIIITNKAQA